MEGIKSEEFDSNHDGFLNFFRRARSVKSNVKCLAPLSQLVLFIYVASQLHHSPYYIADNFLWCLQNLLLSMRLDHLISLSQPLTSEVAFGLGVTVLAAYSVLLRLEMAYTSVPGDRLFTGACCVCVSPKNLHCLCDQQNSHLEAKHSSHAILTALP